MPRQIKIITFIIVILTFVLVGHNLGQAFFGLPSIDKLEKLQMVEATQVFDINGKLISKLFEENRIVVSINNIAPQLQYAIIANEDARFYSHAGIDPIGIARAVLVNIRSGSFSEGASTITQQLARNMFLNQEQTLTRKFKEAMLAIIIERKFSKQEILEAYLNQVYFGEGAYGVEAASQLYFGKRAKDLTLAESALIAGIPRGPNIYSPYVNKEAALNRRTVVLSGMEKSGYINNAQFKEAKDAPLKLSSKKNRIAQASYFLDYVANELVGRYGANRVYKGGLKVYTTLDLTVQQAAEGVLGGHQGAVLAIDPKNGYIKAMVGGRDYKESQINRVFAEVRQPGSAFKPILYAAALNKGFASNSIIVDEAININGYKPQNYDKSFRGPITLNKALRWSVNTVAVKLGQQVGIGSVLDLAKTMGISTLTPDDNNLATALGGLTGGVSLYEISAAYTTFANGGILSKPVAILKVLDENDKALEEAGPVQQYVLRPEVAYIITDILRGSLKDGTATPANIGRPAAGKTGTTDNYEAAWFIGYTPDLLTGIFIGNDNRSPVSISGTGACGLWGKMMAKALENTPESDFQVPPNVINNVPVFTNSGKYAYTTNAYSEIEYSSFIKGTEPKPSILPNAPIIPPVPPKKPAPPSSAKPTSPTAPKPPLWKFWQ